MNDESLLKFPCDFPIKMMGRDTQDFRDIARSLVEKHTGPLDDDFVQGVEVGIGVVSDPGIADPDAALGAVEEFAGPDDSCGQACCRDEGFDR